MDMFGYEIILKKEALALLLQKLFVAGHAHQGVDPQKDGWDIAWQEINKMEEDMKGLDYYDSEEERTF